MQWIVLLFYIFNASFAFFLKASILPSFLKHLLATLFSISSSIYSVLIFDQKMESKLVDR